MTTVYTCADNGVTVNTFLVESDCDACLDGHITKKANRNLLAATLVPTAMLDMDIYYLIFNDIMGITNEQIDTEKANVTQYTKVVHILS